MKRYANKDDGILNLVQRLDRTLDLPERRIITFISARSGEGTSTIARDYVRALEDMVDHKILLIDAGRLDESYFDANQGNPAVTIVETVAAGQPLDKALFPLGNHTHFGRWAGEGRARIAATKLLNNDKFWTDLHESFGTVVIDAPSLQESPDGIALAAHADATILVVEAEKTRQPVVENLRDTLTAADANVVGLVMNKRRFYIPAKVYQKM